MRPTPDRVRETLFNWLQPSISGARCLDLYAGSGALGLEALSRGAAGVVFVEQQRRAAQGLEELLREWQRDPPWQGESPGQREPQAQHEPVWRVICGQALQFLAAAGGAGKSTPHERYDIVFLDPPFASGELPAAAAALERGEWLAPGARIYLEHAREGRLPALPEGWHELRAGHAGEVGYHLFTPAASASVGEGQP